MGHISPDAAKMLVKKGMVEGLTLDESSKIESCDSCEYGKAHRKAIGKERVAPRASNIGDEIYSDVWGPSPVQTIGGREYYTTFTDGNSSFTHLYLLHFKSETFDAYKAYEAELKKQELVTLSTMEAEYVAATHAAKELVWFRRLLGEIFRPLNVPINLFSDSQSAIALAHSTS